MIRRACRLAILLAAAGGAPALGAPQPLGLVATGDPVRMQCGEHECMALLSAFCLQQKRLPPDFGTAYVAAEGTAIDLLAVDADGRTRRLDAGPLVEFRSRYGFTAIEARLPSSTLAAIGAVSVAIEVGPRASMLPWPIVGDPDPLDGAEVALLTGSWRLAAETVMEGDSERALAARVTAGLINALPRSGDIARADRAALWARVADQGAPTLARRTFEACGRAVDQSVGYSLRKCLEERHESLQIDNTQAFWDSLGGS